MAQGLKQRDHIDIVFLAELDHCDIIGLGHAAFLPDIFGGVPLNILEFGNDGVVLHRNEHVIDQIGMENLGIIVHQQMGGPQFEIRPVFDLAGLDALIIPQRTQGLHGVERAAGGRADDFDAIRTNAKLIAFRVVHRFRIDGDYD
ncbi:hypothetical protein SDC9_183541 [bioreactor metagenome]|uniref:Uncharacterized protein n=1 Tax=bioreactor metagenome TaxID=1076179 RepID=A0A645HBZ2_9ZZZZ